MSFENENENRELKTENDEKINEVQTSEKPVYRWTFSDQYNHDEHQREATKKHSHSGARAYAIIMTVAFVLSIALLVGTMFIGDGIIVTKYQDRTIYVRQFDSDSGILTVPEISHKCNPSVVGITTTLPSGVGTGTGIIKSADGYILTNYHVVEGYNRITVTLHDEKEYKAKFIGGDAQADIALLKIEAPNLVAATFGDSDNLIQGEEVVAIGMPAGLDYGWSVTKGIISGINRDVSFYEGDTLVKTMTVIQTDTTINRGNSGGPLINYFGEVIGINTLKLADDYEGMGFAIPIKTALTISDDIQQNVTGYITAAPATAAIGIRGGNVKKADGYDADGVIITSFLDDTSDASKKLKINDIIIGIENKTVVVIDDIINEIKKFDIGDTIKITYIRNGNEYTANVILTSSN